MQSKAGSSAESGKKGLLGFRTDADAIA